MTDLLNSLVTRLQCAHVVVHAPAWHAHQTVPPVPPGSAAEIDVLTRKLLWWMVRERPGAQILNRIRLTPGAPVVPYRLLLCPLRSDRSTVGVVAAIRAQAQPPFEAADAALLSEAAPALQEYFSARVEETSALMRRPAFELEVMQHFQPGQPACVIYVDLDHMHAVNDVAGFDAGDQVLREIARLWESRLPPAGSLATHLAGDRYAAVLFNHTVNQASDWADRTREAIAALRLAGAGSGITASMGLVLLRDAQSLHHALASAETACRMAKERGRNRVEIYASADSTMMRRGEEVRESRDMVDALEENRLVLHAQPIVALASPERPSRFEVLLRIRDHDGELVSVGDYMGAADRYQLFERLDRWVVQSVLQVIAPRAQQLLAQAVRLSVNLTGHSISQQAFADFVRTAIKQHQVPADLLVFEFTEAAAVRNLGATRRFVDRMTDMGASIALDDFGTGVSSLMHLKELAVQQIKIDGSFIRDILTNTRSDALVHALVLIAQQLGLQTVAEYVETKAVSDHLRALGVQYAQGYFYGRPRPLLDVLSEHLAAGEKSAA